MSIRFRFYLGLAALLLLVTAFGLQAKRGFNFESDILALLPSSGSEPVVEEAQQRFASSNARGVMFLVGSTDIALARESATDLANKLQATALFEQINLTIHWSPKVSAEFWLPYRLGLLSERHRQLLVEGRDDLIFAEARRALFTPSGLSRPLPLSQDLAGLMSDFLIGQTRPPGRLQLSNGMLKVDDGETHWIFLRARLQGNPFELSVQQQAAQGIHAAMDQVLAQQEDLSILKSGIVFHAQKSAARAQTEITGFGLMAVSAIVLLMWTSFASPLPLLLGLSSLICGGLAGLLACQWLFGGVHLITLVFGTSLIGVAIDYSLHFFSDQFRLPSIWRPALAVGAVAGAIVVGHVTTVIAYASLLVPPFPGLRQMAVFSISGLIVACLVVLCIFPQIPVRARQRPPGLYRVARICALQAPRWQFRLPHAVSALLVSVIAVGGCLLLTFEDDVRLLQAPQHDLLEEDARLRDLLGLGFESRFLVVHGASAQAVLEREEGLRETLSQLQQEGVLESFQAVSSAVPSIHRQRQVRELQMRTVWSEQGLIPRLMRSLGSTDFEILRNRLNQSPDDPYLSPEAWLADASSAALAPLWLGDIGGQFASIVSLSGIKSASAIKTASASLEGVSFVDKVTDISAVLKTYRELALRLMSAVAALVLLILAIRYGWRGGIACILPPLGGCVLALALQGWMGVPVNLFSTFSLLLLLGMGIDYSVYLREGRHGEQAASSSMFAISLSALTTLLAFGLLNFSSTPFIRSIGLTLAPGILMIWLLAVWLRPQCSNTSAQTC